MHKPSATAARSRLLPEERRRQLLDVAASLLAEGGPDRVQMSEVANAAGVTRPVVYRFFPNRQAIIVAVLEDFEEDLNSRFAQRFRKIPGSLADVTRAFVEAMCDSIEAKGPGAWNLLGGKGPDPEIGKVGRAIMERMVEPWMEPIAGRTGATRQEVVTCAYMLVATAQAALDRWIDDHVTRDEAVVHATRGISALLTEFSVKR